MYLTAQDVQAISEQLRVKAKADHLSRVSLDKLDSGHHQPFTRAISNVLSTDVAEFTYAHIIDGLPTEEVAWDRRVSGIFGNHPIDEHEELCPGALKKARNRCKEWTSDILLFNPKLVDTFQTAEVGSKRFESSLIELVAVALHQFGALLFQLDFQLRKGDISAVVNWTQPIDGHRIQPHPTLFNHPSYTHDDIYPDGVADIIRYWAEDRILGEVVVFDRKAQEANEDTTTAPNVYFHSCRGKVTNCVYQLRDEQQKALVDFFLKERDEPQKSSPLPVLGDAENTVRVDAFLALVPGGLHQDIWERKPPSRETVFYWQKRSRSTLDYPEELGEVFRINALLGIPLPKRNATGNMRTMGREMGRMIDQNIPRRRHSRSMPSVQLE